MKMTHKNRMRWLIAILLVVGLELTCNLWEGIWDSLSNTENPVSTILCVAGIAVLVIGWKRIKTAVGWALGKVSATIDWIVN